MVEDCYGINLRHLQRMAEQFYGDDDLTIWMPHTDTARGPYTPGMLHRCAVMHKAITILMLKLECQVIDRNPDFKMQDRDFLRRINWEKGTVMVGGREYPMRDTSFPTIDPADPTALNSDAPSWTTVTSAPAGATSPPRAAPPARADRISCGICGAASCRPCMAAAP